MHQHVAGVRNPPITPRMRSNGVGVAHAHRLPEIEKFRRPQDIVAFLLPTVTVVGEHPDPIGKTGRATVVPRTDADRMGIRHADNSSGGFMCPIPLHRLAPLRPLGLGGAQQQDESEYEVRVADSHGNGVLGRQSYRYDCSPAIPISGD